MSSDNEEDEDSKFANPKRRMVRLWHEGKKVKRPGLKRWEGPTVACTAAMEGNVFENQITVNLIPSG